MIQVQRTSMLLACALVATSALPQSAGAPPAPLPTYGSGGGCSVVRYCTSTPNSSGQAAVIDLHGGTSVSANATMLTATGCAPDQFGAFLYGATQVQYPFFDGTLCVSPFGQGLMRVPGTIVTSDQGDVRKPVDLTAMDPLTPMSVGSTWNFQLIFRDVGPNGPTANLTDALSVTFCP